MPFKLEYGDGTTVQGDRYADNVTIAGFTADPQTFGSAIWYTSPRDWNADGRLIHPKFSLKLSSSGAEMYLGGANSMLYKGDITYTHVTEPGFWQVSMEDVRVNGDKILTNVPAIFDTGASFIYGDWNRVSELYRHIGGTLTVYKGFGYYYLPCDSFPTMSLTFGGRSFEIPPEVLRLLPLEKGSPNCFSAICAGPASTKFWIIGMAFLQGVYSVFDYTTSSSQVGFANLA